jgi:hypothetical protein
MNSKISPVLVGFKMQPEAVGRLDVVAKAKGVTRSEFVRSLVCEAVGAEIDVARTTGPVANGEELRAILSELGRHGSLLNQIAKAMNTRGPTPAAHGSLSSMETSYTEVMHTLRRLLGVTSTP